MKKNLLTIAIATALTIATAMPAFAAYIVAPSTDKAGSEYSQWEREENQRWIDRMVNEHSDRIKAIENPVERINEVVKAVASYSEYGHIEVMSRAQRWEVGCLGPDMMSEYTIALGKAVGLDIMSVGNMNSTQLSQTNYCIVNGTEYWFDSYYYDMRKDEKYLAHVGQPSWVVTQQQLNENHVDAEIITEDIVLENGQVITLVQ